MVQFNQKSISISLALVLSGFSSFWNATPINAQLGGSDQPIPEESRPGASRGECDRPETYNTLPTLIVSNDISSLTTSSGSPRFYVYVPFALRTRDPGMFTLRAENGRIVEQQHFSNAPNGGILEISLSQQLQIGQNYQWFFETFCNDPTRSNSTDHSFLRSSSIRLEASGDPGNHFYDGLKEAADLKRQGSPTAWNDLLRKLGLAHLSEQEIIGQ
ncbi:DUF928 domain-containing protein [Nodosilinea sp. PGN35]|uniref:DUF928 domain-containing protein n=1 Tax=Nodosilinea sp. PGN35 TaxID=3020489 RepID=UPI0023B27822|nr:DUF928 domain-containing protein [Nodosilinea sp. TSF1-S3]MDF0365110.1 DUF928 domain-containing protein [Nodosilinea sp. TSF1-S3]